MPQLRLSCSRYQMNIKEASQSRSAVGEALASALPEVSIEVGNDVSNDRHFRTDELLANLKNRTVSSGFITVTAQGVQFGLTLASTMILARLLTPRDFGLVAMVWTMMGFCGSLKKPASPPRRCSGKASPTPRFPIFSGSTSR